MDGRIELYNKIYSDKPDKWNLKHRNQFAYYVLQRHIDEPETFLDIGCGNGHTIEFFSKIWPSTIYTGIDLSDEAIRLCGERTVDAEFICTTYEELDLPIFDVVIVMGVAEHFEDLIPSLRRLKEFGKLIYIEVPNCLLAAKINGSPNLEEGYRKTFYGAEQMEWHLKRSTWEQQIRFAGLEIVESYPGPDLGTEFVWMLK